MDEAELLRLERLKYEGFSRSYEQIKGDFTLEERKIMVTPRSQLTSEQITLDEGIARRIREKRDADPVYQERSRERVISLMKQQYHQGLIKTFEEDSAFSEVKITQEAYEKAEEIARRMVAVSRSPDEIYMFPLGDEDGEITDVYIPYQNVGPSLCTLHESPTLREEDRQRVAEMGKQIVGWMHSHGEHSVFHSRRDNRNLKCIVMDGLKKEVVLSSFRPDTLMKFEVCVLPSLVFNARGDAPDVLLALQYWDFADQTSSFLLKKPRLSVRRSGDALDYDHIDGDIWERVISDAGFTQEFADRMTYGVKGLLEEGSLDGGSDGGSGGGGLDGGSEEGDSSEGSVDDERKV